MRGRTARSRGGPAARNRQAQLHRDRRQRPRHLDVPRDGGARLASFNWLHAPTAGQKLEIDWFGPSGERVAVWKNRTLKTDTDGTRLYSFISRKTIETRPGHWRVELSVGGVERAQQTFTVAKKRRKAS